MAPEQIEGLEADARTDIFAFGALLFEMLTGRTAFEGKTRASLLGAILKDRPPAVSHVRPAVPAAVDRIINTCLTKDPDDRYQSARDLLRDLRWVASASAAESLAAPARQRRDRFAWLLTGVTSVALIAALPFLVIHFREQPNESASIRFTVFPPPGVAFAGSRNLPPQHTVSPDGRLVVFLVRRPTDGRSQLWLRPLDSLDARPLPGTEFADSPFWSPDSRSIGFFSPGALKKVDIGGGPTVTIAEAPMTARVVSSGTWSRDGTIVFAPGAGGLVHVPAAGGQLQPVTMLNQASEERARWPQFLPDGRRFLYFSQPGSEIRLGSLDTEETRNLLKSDSRALFAAPGYVFFIRGGSLMAQSFDASRAAATGEASVIAEQIAVDPLGGAPFSVSDTGVLTYRAGGGTFPSQLVWFDREGKRLGALGDVDDFDFVSLSPDGRHVSVSVLDAPRRTRDIWIYDVARAGARTRLTFDPANERLSLWSLDGKQIIFNSDRTGRLELFATAASGAGREEPVAAGGDFSKYPDSFSPDGRFLLYASGPDTPTKTGNDLWMLPLFGDRKAFPFLDGPFNEFLGLFSPDGKWVAYHSNESGRNEVYVTQFPDRVVKVPVSTAGGTFPRWRGDGRELFYLAADGMMMAAEVKGLDSAFEVGAARSLFEGRVRGAGAWPYDVSRDGQRFIVNTSDETGTATPITVVVNWMSALKR